jgi:pimeloyl-ACP methyl ester carboxylesterase
VQWFERVRFEVHADRVLLGLLGRELYPTLSQVVAAPASGPVPRFEPGACPFGGPGVGNLECGYLTVLEERSQPGGPTIRLPVAIFRTSSTTPAPDPVVYLAGGPGGAAFKNAPLLFQVFAPFLQHRDLIIFDQRGTGQAEPALECPEYTALLYEQLDEQLAPQAAIEAEASALLRCRERLAASGVNLAAYTSAASAADVNDLRLALGYSQWNLLGISYGTRLALTTMRDYPAGIRSVILDSSYPLQVDLYSSLPENMHRVLSTLFAGCAADPACRAAYPDLETTFYALVSRLQASPVLLPVANPTTGQVEQVLVDGSRLLALTFQMLYNQETLVLLPRMIQDASQENYVTMSLLLALQISLIEEISMGMHYSVQCSEEVFFTSADQLRAAVDAFPRLQPYFQSSLGGTAALLPFCESWRTQPPPAWENAPVQSDIPTLVLAGQYDPITPPAWGQLAAQSLSNSYVYTFPGLAHGISPTGGCAADVIRAFLAAPTSAPDGSCIGGMSAPSFWEIRHRDQSSEYIPNTYSIQTSRAVGSGSRAAPRARPIPHQCGGCATAGQGDTPALPAAPGSPATAGAYPPAGSH